MDFPWTHTSVAQREKDVELHQKRAPVSEISQDINNNHDTVHDTSTRFNNRITEQRTIKADKKEKVKSIILDHIMKNPKVRLSEIQAALKHQHNIAANLRTVSKWLNEARKREYIGRKIKPDEEEKAKSIIFNYIMKDPKARAIDICKALKDHHRITVSLSTVHRLTGESKKSIAANPGQPREEESDLETEQHLETVKQKQEVCEGTLEQIKRSQREDIYREKYRTGEISRQI